MKEVSVTRIQHSHQNTKSIKDNELEEEKGSFSKVPLDNTSKMWHRLSDHLQMLTEVKYASSQR